MRLLLLTTCLPFAALAEDVVLPTDVTGATIYARGAEVVRSAEVDLPAGTHRLLLPLPPTDAMIGAPRLDAPGLTLGQASPTRLALTTDLISGAVTDRLLGWAQRLVRCFR